MEKNLTTRCVAIVEKCAMTETALRYILSNDAGKRYSIHFYKDTQALKREFASKNFIAVIFLFPVAGVFVWKACSSYTRLRKLVPKYSESYWRIIRRKCV